MCMGDSTVQHLEGAEQNEGAPQNIEPAYNMQRVLNGTVRSASARGMSSGTATAAGATATSGLVTAGGGENAS